MGPSSTRGPESGYGEASRAPRAAGPAYTLVVALLLGPATAFAAEPRERLLSLSVAATDTILALGAGDRLVGIDDAGRMVPATAQIAKVGPADALNMDAVYAARPSRAIAARGGVPATTLEQLKKSGIVVELLPADDTVDGLPQRVLTIGVVVGKGAEAKALARQIQLDLERLAIMREKNPVPVPAVFVLVGADKRVRVAGGKSAAHALLELSGARNVAAERGVADEIDGDTLAALGPQVIVMGAGDVARLGGTDRALALPALAGTSAANTRSVVVVQDYVVGGIGPASVKVAFEVFRALRR